MSTPARDTFASPASWIAPARHAALADLAFGPRAAAPAPMGSSTMSRHLALMSPAALAIDLADAAQRDFGDYELVEQLGQGGMGVVYRARQRSLDREVALKLLAAGPWASADFIERFKREAQSAARMQHPNIVPIYEIGTHAEMTFFTMRLVRGGTLAGELASRGPIAAKVAARLLRTIAEAVDYAHRLGVLHLDLKPGNVLIDEHGEPQVADFGLARRLDESLSIDSDEVSGTPCYMAPEQAVLRSHKLSPATDIYGLGAVLYECLTGRPPFLGATPQETLHRAVHDPVVAPRAHAPSVPLDLEAVCLKCLAKDPRERYRSARELAEDLGRFIDERPVSVRPLRRAEKIARWARREPRFAAALAAAALALVVGFAATLVQWRRADANATEARDGVWRLRAQSAQAALADGDGFLGLRPLVENLAEMEAAGRADEARVERQRIGTVLANAPKLVDVTSIPASEFVTSVAISPDGRRFALATAGNRDGRSVRQFDMGTGRELWKTSTLGLTHNLVFADMPHGEIAYTPDGRRLLLQIMPMPVFAAPSHSDGILLDAEDGRPLLPPTDGKHADVVFDDDTRLALVRFRTDPSLRFPDAIRFYSAQSWQPLGPRVTSRELPVASFEWLPGPGGEWLGTSDFVNFTLAAVPSLETRWTLSLPPADQVRAWRFLPGGSRIALGTIAGRVHLVDVADGSRTELPSLLAATIRSLDVDADGRTLVGTTEEGTLAAWDVATGLPRAAPIVAPTEGFGRMRSRVVGDTFYATIGNQLASWDASPLSPFGNALVPGSARLRNRRSFWAAAYDVHPASDLLIAGGSDSLVTHWRLPQPALFEEHAAALLPRVQLFDGERIVVVDGRDVRIVDAADRSTRSPVFRHPAAVHFAELDATGRRLVTLADRTVRVFEPDTGAAVGAPIVLPQTPLLAELATGASVLAFATLEREDGKDHLRLHVVDLETGALRSQATTPFSSWDAPALEPRGRFALLLRQGQPEATLLALDGGALPCDRIAGEPGFGTYAFAFTPDGRQLWLQSAGTDRRSRITRWDLSTCARVEAYDAQQGSRSIGLAPYRDGVLAHRLTAGSLSIFEGGARREVPALGQDIAMREFAVSPDFRRAAQASANAVQLFDLVRGERLTAPLTAAIAGNDGIAKLAFAPDGDRLLARSLRGRLIVWHLPEASADVESLRTLSAMLAPDNADPPWTDAQLASLRATLRAEDPRRAGGRAPAEPRTIVLEPAPGSGVAARFVPLDLAPAMNVPMNGTWPRVPAQTGDQPTVVPGVHRYAGIDWRIEGGVQLSWGGPATSIHPTQRFSAPVPVGGLVAKRVHVLAYMHIPLRRGVPPRPFAHVHLEGDAGRTAKLDVMTLRDVVRHDMPELALPTARIAWSGSNGTAVLGGDGTGNELFSSAYAVGLDVPEGFGPIRALRFEAAEGPMEAPLFYAATLEIDPAR